MPYNDLFKEALRLFDAGSFDDAESLLRRILQTSPEQPDVLNLLGLIAQSKGLHGEACPLFAAAIRGNPDDVSFLFNLAFSLKAEHQYAEALLNFKKVARKRPDIKETFNEIAAICEAEGRLDEARRYWQTAIGMSPSYAEAKINLANSYRLDNPPQAEEMLRSLRNEYPDNALLLYDLAWILYNRGENKEALALVSAAAEFYPASDGVFCLRGMICLALGQENDAEESFRRAEKLNGDNLDAKLGLADILSRAGQFTEAEKRYCRILEIVPDNFSAHHNYAEMLYRQRRLPEALEEYRRAVILNPHSAEASNNLGIILKDLQEYEEALGLFFNALKLNPRLSEISVNLAETIVLLSAGDENAATTAAENWVRLYPDDPFARHTLAALKGDKSADDPFFIEKLFDNFADNYELVMQNLDYAAPLAIRRIAGPLEGRLADIGCGSGLVGLAVKTDRNQIIGVDLSAKMLKLAEAKNVYNELIRADIFDFLRRRNDFEWILAADVLGYLGALESFFPLCRGKNIIFSIETSERKNFVRQKSGRFSHSPEYIEKLLLQNGFYDISKEYLTLRSENGIPVKGCIFKAFGEK